MPVTTDVQRVRLLISDPDSTEFTDDELQAFLDLEGGAVRLAAATALETMASQLLVVESDDIKIDGSKRAGVLIAQATKLREQHYVTDGSGFIVVPGPRF